MSLCRPGQLDPRILNRRCLIAQRIARQSILQLRHGPDIAGVQLINRNCGLSLHRRDVRKFLWNIPTEVLQGRVIFQNAREHFEIRDAPSKRVRNRLEYIGGNGLRVGFMALGSISTPASFTLHPLVLRRRRSVVDDEIHHTVGANVPQSRAEDNGKNFVLTNSVVQRRNQVFFPERSSLEKLFHQLVIAFRHQFHEPFVRRQRLIFQIGRNLRFLPLAVASHLVGVSLHSHQVDHAR
jgi:hypothetical protein